MVIGVNTRVKVGLGVVNHSPMFLMVWGQKLPFLAIISVVSASSLMVFFYISRQKDGNAAT